MPAANRFDWKHALYTIGAAGAAACVFLASGQGQGVALALHISAASLAAATFLTGYITHSLSEPAPPPVVVAVSSQPGTPAVVLPSQVTPVTPFQPPPPAGPVPS